MSSRPQAAQLHKSVSPELARAFDGFFGPPAREIQPSSTPRGDRRSVLTTHEGQAQLPSYTVLGRY